jgi:uncharacterized protein (TIGR02611 family)
MATEEAARSDDENRHELLIKLRERKLRHKQRHIVYRIAVAVLGFLTIVAGALMSAPGVPGPGIAVMLIGLGFLALEFERAERMLERAVIWAERAQARAAATTRGQRIFSAVVGALAVAAFLVAAVMWDIPLLPVL